MFQLISFGYWSVLISTMICVQLPQAEQLPPQSTPVSLPFWIPSLQVGAATPDWVKTYVLVIFPPPTVTVADLEDVDVFAL